MAGNTQQNQAASTNEREFLRRVLGNLRTRDPAKLDEAQRAIESRLRNNQISAR